MPLARNIARTTEDTAASEPAQPQIVRAPVAYDTAGRPVRFVAEDSGRQQQPSNSRRMLSAIFSRGRQALLAALRWRAPVSISRKTFASACAVGFVLLIGFVAYVYRRPASPLPPGALLMNRTAKQDVPFGPVSITSPATVKSGPGTAATTSPAPRPAIPKPSAARRNTNLRWHPRQDTSSTAMNQQSDNQ